MNESNEHSGGIGDQAIQPQYYNLMNSLAEVIDETLNGFPNYKNIPEQYRRRKVGFVLLVFPFGDRLEKRCNYISSAKRDEVITLLKEQLQYFEAQAKVERKNK